VGLLVSTILGKGLPFYGRCGLQRSFNQPGIWCRQHEARQWSALRSWCREYSYRRRWRSGVTVSYGRDTDADEVQRSKELIVMGRRTRKLSVQHSTLAIATKRSLAKASIDLGFTSLLDSEDLKVMSTDQERIRDGWPLHIDFSRTLTTQENFYFCCFHLASRKRIDATRSSRFVARDQVDRDFQKTITKKRKANKRVP
jgi:hypothetical protein